MPSGFLTVPPIDIYVVAIAPISMWLEALLKKF